MKVSVFMLTYNHEKFIAQAINSVLMQQVNFNYEIVIAEDYSSDRTRDIILEYENKYPDKVRLFLAEKNYNCNSFSMRARQTCQGEYIALCEGDDYWTDPLKLQKQVDFLDANPDFAICFHNVQVLSEDRTEEGRNWNSTNQKKVSDLEDILMINFIATCSTLFRNHLKGNLPDWFCTLKVGDWGLHILNAHHGKIGYLDEVMGVYRQHSGGFYSSLAEVQKQEIIFEFFQDINRNLDFQYDEVIGTGISKYFLECTERSLNYDDYELAKSYFRKYLAGRPLNKYVGIIKLIRVYLRLYPRHFFQKKLALHSKLRKVKDISKRFLLVFRA